jgi:hypothetical protein
MCLCHTDEFTLALAFQTYRWQNLCGVGIASHYPPECRESVDKTAWQVIVQDDRSVFNDIQLTKHNNDFASAGAGFRSNALTYPT